MSGIRHDTALWIDAAGVPFAHQSLVALDDAHPETWTDPTAPGMGMGSFNGSYSSWVSRDSPVNCTTHHQLGGPIVFPLLDNETGAILSAGRMVNPEAADLSPARRTRPHAISAPCLTGPILPAGVFLTLILTPAQFLAYWSSSSRSVGISPR